VAELSALRRVSDTKSILKKERALYGSVQTEIPVQCFHINAPPRGKHMARRIPESVGAAWQELYTAALLELDPDKLRTLIAGAEQAIAARYLSLDPVRDAEEAQRITDATRALSVLRREAK